MSNKNKGSLKKDFIYALVIFFSFFWLSFICLHMFLYYQENLINNYVNLFKVLYYVSLFFLVLSGFYFIIRTYKLIIKPINENQKIVTRINSGEKNLRLKYKYNNELANLINSFNRFIDFSQKSFKVIEEQYNRLKLYNDIGEINYVEFSFNDRIIKIFYSKKFVNKYQLENNIMTYSVKEYAKLVHPNDRRIFFTFLKEIKKYKEDLHDKEYNLVYRLKFPYFNNYCYVSITGQVKRDEQSDVLFFIGVQVDVTSLKKTQDKLQQQEEQYRLIIENSTDLITKMSPDGKMLFASKSFKDLFKNDKQNVQEYDDMLKVTNRKWLDKVLKPPFSSQELILIETSEGDKWISWNNDAILNENNEVEYIISVGHDITELKRINDKLKYDSEHDLLTGLYNQRGIFNSLDRITNLKTLAAFFIDVNNFKNINDLYGHKIGDKIINLIAKDLLAFDKDKYIVGRLAGAEFLLLVPNFVDDNSLNFLKKYLSKLMNKSYHINNTDIFISASIGYALYPEDTDDFDKLISFADIAMYESRVNHFNRCLRFNQEMFEAVNKKVATLNQLKIAIDNKEFDVYFQEIINTQTKEVAYIEALVRWNSKDGIIMPGDFIPIAEESGIIQYIDLQVIEKSFALFKEIKKDPKSKYNKTRLSVNVSPILLLRSNFPNTVDKLATNYKLNKSDICIEINENTFVNNKEQSRRQIKLLRELGFVVALDDFGREYSSLSILNKVDFDIIKLDRLFIVNLENKLNIEIINMVNKIAQLTNNLVIVEGVETEEQRDLLVNLGCYLMQGFLFSKPSKLFVKDKILQLS